MEENFMANLTKRPSERKGEIVARPVVPKSKGERNAMSTSIATVQKEFLIEQEVKGNSKDTLKYYKTSFRQMNRFIAKQELADNLPKNMTDEQIIKAGQQMPLGVLLDKDFEISFKR